MSRIDARDLPDRFFELTLPTRSQSRRSRRLRQTGNRNGVPLTRSRPSSDVSIADHR
jgi:hypothetical protein